ncbi:MAG TPA: TIGR04053 family radical SAM/SPASM domain-containing protein [Vicinamibacteria bacterium]|nr:TIGR04053 family radical SAM/SPASM domain-containing protein [Vicinamibacteria bacterium]
MNRPLFADVDFQRAPFLVIWETTQACALACRHCRASARPWRDPLELTTVEGRALIEQVAKMGTPLLVLSGGDPVNRPDLFELVRHAKRAGLRVATIPAATADLTEDLVVALRDAGLDQMALSLDFPRAELHDTFRGVPGAFAKTMQAAGWARAAGLPLQINTTVCGDTAPYLGEMAELVERLGVVFWEVFFLVPTGRGSALGGLAPEDCERLFDFIYRTQKKGGFVVKVTEAPHYRRHVAQRERRLGGEHGRPRSAVPMPALLTRSEGPGHTVGLAPRGVNAGSGFLFVSHVGDIYPSGFLPLRAGNVRATRLEDAYRDSELFRGLRAPDRLKGRCGRCEYRFICGGSRSRAFAMTGDHLETDPWCTYQPAAAAHAAL